MVKEQRKKVKNIKQNKERKITKEKKSLPLFSPYNPFITLSIKKENNRKLEKKQNTRKIEKKEI
jgi:hypothetical protein